NMKPVTQIVLVSPGVDNLQSGPDADWLEQLGANLDLVMKKYTDETLQTMSPGSKKTVGFAGRQVYLILVMHTSYASSGEYMKFLERIAAESRDEIEHILRIDTAPDIPEKTPDLFANAASIELFEFHEESEQSHWIGEDSTVYWSRLLDLAAEVKMHTGHLTEQASEGKGNTIYLARTAADMGRNRNIVKRELLEHGFRVVPDTNIKIHQKDLKSHVQNLVDKSRLAIHLLGNTYGEALKNSGYSVAEIQFQYITEYLAAIENDPVHSAKELTRLIWIDPEFKPVDSKQEEFINKVKRNIENLHRTEIIQTPLELFKTLIINRLRNIDAAATMSGSGERSNGKFIYIIHASDDQ
ncbi:MAG: DUF4062 domain-containing protein, partial [Bacteroidales bacterium]|nr:DUF4062 domain-containing protein [Bacteroidales bacterium]